MNIQDCYNNGKKVTFDMQDRLDDKIDKLTSMMNKLTAWGNNEYKKFKPKIYQRRRGQSRNYYDQDKYQSRYTLSSGYRRGRGQYGQNYKGRQQYIHNYENYYKETILEKQKIYRGQNFRGGYSGIYRNDNFARGRSRSRE